MFPSELDKVSTNMHPDDLRRVVAAVEAKQVEWLPGAGGMFAEYADGKFRFEGRTYFMSEYVETVNRLDCCELQSFSRVYFQMQGSDGWWHVDVAREHDGHDLIEELRPRLARYAVSRSVADRALRDAPPADADVREASDRMARRTAEAA